MTVRDISLLKHLGRTQGRWVGVPHGSVQVLCNFQECCLVGYNTKWWGSNWLPVIIFQHTLTQVHCLPTSCPVISYILQLPPTLNDLRFSPEMKAAVSSEILITSCCIPDANHLNGCYCETFNMYFWWTNISSNVLGEDVQQTIKPNKTRSSKKNLRNQLFSSDALTSNNSGLIIILINEPLLHRNYTRTDSRRV